MSSKRLHYNAALKRKLIVYLKQCLPLDTQWIQKTVETAKFIRIKHKLFMLEKVSVIDSCATDHHWVLNNNFFKVFS